MEKISVLGNNRRTDRRGTVSLESPLPFSPLTYLTPQNSFGTRSHFTALTLNVHRREICIHVRLPISKLEGTAADAAPMLFLANHFHICESAHGSGGPQTLAGAGGQGSAELHH